MKILSAIRIKKIILLFCKVFETHKTYEEKNINWQKSQKKEES